MEVKINKKNSKLKTLGRIVVVLLLYFVMIFLGVICTMILTGICYSIKEGDLHLGFHKMKLLIDSNPLWFQCLMTIVQNMVTVIIVLINLDGSLKDRINELKLAIKPNSYKLFIIGGLVAFINIFVITAIGVLIGMTKFEGIGVVSFSTAIFALLISIIQFLSVGFGEEIFSRGYILKTLLDSGNRLWGILVSSFIFMSLHIFTYSKLLDFVDVFFAGILLGCMYIVSESLWLSVGFHFMWDFTQSFIVNIENAPISKISIFEFRIPEDIYIHGINIGCKFEVVFIIIELLLIASILLINKKMNRNKNYCELELTKTLQIDNFIY